MTAADVERTSVPVDILDVTTGEPTGLRVRIMNPVLCMESRVHNIVGLPGKRRSESMKQLRASILCARAYLLELLDRGMVRAVLDANEHIFRFCSGDFHGRRILQFADGDPFDAVLCQPPLPAKFIQLRYPQMQTRLAARRTRVPMHPRF